MPLSDPDHFETTPVEFPKINYHLSRHKRRFTVKLLRSRHLEAHCGAPKIIIILRKLHTNSYCSTKTSNQCKTVTHYQLETLTVSSWTLFSKKV